jgi:hypothetical protein
MASAPDKSKEFAPRQLAELSALADGSLAADRRAAVREQIAASPELSELYERERQVVEMLHEARASARAPASLRSAIAASRPPARVRAQRRIVFGGAFAGALAVVALALVLVLPAGTPGAPSISDAAALAVRGIAAPAPVPDPTAPDAKLGDKLGDIYFPNWKRSFGWRAVGQRSDHIGGRLALTVYYGGHGHRVAYTIVDAPALAQPAATLTRLHGGEYRTLMVGGRLVVTWQRENHTCVLSGHGVPASVLRRLAAWKAQQA